MLRRSPLTRVQLHGNTIIPAEPRPADHVLHRQTGIVQVWPGRGGQHEVDRRPDVEERVEVLEVLQLEAVLRHGELLVEADFYVRGHLGAKEYN